MRKISVGVLGASGVIGQRFVQLLESHPWFEIAGLYASGRSDGKRFGDVLKVRDFEFKSETLDRTIEQLEPSKVASACRVAFSGLPTDVAARTESDIAGAGGAVFSNAASHRMEADVPLLIPECNAPHLDAVREQKRYSNGGMIVTNANCSTTGIALPLAAIDRALGLKEVVVSTYQAVSGAGYPGVPSLDIMGNCIPYIKSEEEKMETELAKILGSYGPSGFVPSLADVTASCVRVPVIDGHLESLVVSTEKDSDVESMISLLESFRAEPQQLGLPTAPERPVIVRREADRPQPALDANAGWPAAARGMATTVGRVRMKGRRFKMFALSHNTVRGGAGGSVLNAELAVARKLL